MEAAETCLMVPIPCGGGRCLVHSLGPGDYFMEVHGWDETIPSEIFPAPEYRLPTWDEVELSFQKLTGRR